ncbi:MAG: hypothetical protein HY701_01690 [Gemmatimonadetes bacterium]|nr:hypothetical protein [Gemmatimonadota bacterium]
MPALDIALVSIVAWGLLTFGAVEAWAYWPLAAASAIVGGLAIAGSQGRGGIGWALPAGFGLLSAAIAVQLVPIRRPLILHYSPATDAFVQRIGGYKGRLLWADPPPSHALSVNPDTTLVGLLLLCAFAALLIGTARGLAPHQTRNLARALPILGAIAALVAIAQNMAGTGLGYGERDRLVGWMVMVFPLGICQALAPAQSPPVRAKADAKAHALLILVPTVLMGAALVWIGIGALTHTGPAAPANAANAWDDTWSLVGDFQTAGTGLNTYGAVMLVLQPALRPTTGYNDYLQLAAEGGLLLLVPAAIVLLLFCWEALRRLIAKTDALEMRWIRAGAVAGLVMLAAYELASVSLQLPGNAALFAVMCGVAISGTTVKREAGGESRR